MLSINTNVGALQDLFSLGQAQSAASSAMERLSTGLQINSASDAPAGLAVSAKMQAQIGGFMQAVSNAQNGNAMLATADGALSQTQSIIQQIRSISVQAANGTLTSSDRSNLQTTVDQLAAQLTNIAKQTQFNTQNLLDGTLSNVSLQVGANANQTISFSVSAMDAATLGLTGAILGGAGTTNFASASIGTSSKLAVGTTYTIKWDASNTQAIDLYNGSTLVAQQTGSGTLANGATVTFTDVATGTDATLVVGSATLTYSAGATLGTLDYSGPNVSTASAAQTSISSVDTAIQTVTNQRASIGAVQDRLTATIASLQVAEQNLTLANGVIQDANVPQETINLSRAQVLEQSGVSMLVHANQNPDILLKLITG
ncbi:MAG: flagellin N-terminal helical domain-containing protein [bacterium]